MRETFNTSDGNYHIDSTMILDKKISKWTYHFSAKVLNYILVFKLTQKCNFLKGTN